MTDSRFFHPDQVTNPFDCNRGPEEFSSSALLASLVILFVLVFSNQAPHDHDNMLVVVALQMLCISPLLYLTQWFKAYMYEVGIVKVAEWCQRIAFGALGVVLVFNMFKVVLA